jgi:hypothetical protein
MGNPASRGGAPARRRWLALVAISVVLLAGCEFATGTVRTVTELEDAGIRNPSLDFSGGVARLEYDSGGPLDRRAEQDRAAEIIWRNLPFRIEGITVRDRGDGSPLAQRTYPRAVLERLFGPRPEGLDRSPGDLARRVVLWASIGGLVVLAAVILIVVLVVRAVRRRPTPRPAGAWQGQPGPPGQPWAQPGYGQPTRSWPQPQPPAQGQPTQTWPRPQPPGQGQPGQAWPQGTTQPWPRPQGQPPDKQAPQRPGEPPDDWPAGAPEPGERPGGRAPPGARGGPPPAEGEEPPRPPRGWGQTPPG